MKLITTHLLNLTKGDIIYRYPYNGTPQEHFDATQTNKIEVYQIRSINEKSGMLELVMSDSTQLLFALPGEISRVFINVRDLAGEKVWWLNDQL